MSDYFEDDAPPADLLNRDVVRLLFSYLFRYRRYLFLSLFYVAFITGTRLLVPYLSGYAVDHFIVKKGWTVSAAAMKRARPSPEFGARARRGVRLDDTTTFIFHYQLAHASAKEIAALKSAGVLQAEERLLIEPPAGLPAAVQRKIQEVGAAGGMARYGDRYLLCTDSALKRFSAAERLMLRSADWKAVALLSVFIIALFLVQFAAAYLQIVALMKLSQLAMRDLRLDVYRHLLSLELAWFDRNPVGRLVNRVTNDIETLNEMFSSVLVTLFQDIIIMTGVTAVMFAADARLSLVVCASFPFLAAAIVLFRVKARSAYRAIRTTIAQLNAFVNENIAGMRITQIFCQEKRQRGQFVAVNHQAYAANLRQLMVYAVFRPVIDFFRWAVVAAVIFFGAQAIVHDTLSYGLIVMFLSYIASLFEPIGDIAEKFDILQSANAAGEKILGVFKADATAETEPSPAAPAAAARLRGDIAFEDVWASYKPGEWVLRGVSFGVPARSTLAIVGETGSGKSTIISLLGRLYPWQKGMITIDGQNLREIPYRRLRSQTAIVMQDMFLFSRSLRENITLGAAFDPGRFDAITRATHVDRLIRQLPSGANEPVMERGVTFSAGQRQLCSFARALYADPSILILDEATSNIDSETESLIQDAIQNLVRGRTAIIIAHRLSTVRNADQIIVLDKGRIAEQGDHASLLARKGLYYELYNLQFEAV